VSRLNGKLSHFARRVQPCREGEWGAIAAQPTRAFARVNPARQNVRSTLLGRNYKAAGANGLVADVLRARFPRRDLSKGEVIPAGHRHLTSRTALKLLAGRRPGAGAGGAGPGGGRRGRRGARRSVWQYASPERTRARGGEIDPLIVGARDRARAARAVAPAQRTTRCHRRRGRGKTRSWKGLARRIELARRPARCRARSSMLCMGIDGGGTRLTRATSSSASSGDHGAGRIMRTRSCSSTSCTYSSAAVSAFGRAMDASNLIKPACATASCAVIGTRRTRIPQRTSRDGARAGARFQSSEVESATIEESGQVLECFARAFDEFHVVG